MPPATAIPPASTYYHVGIRSFGIRFPIHTLDECGLRCCIQPRHTKFDRVVFGSAREHRTPGVNVRLRGLCCLGSLILRDAWVL